MLTTPGRLRRELEDMEPSETEPGFQVYPCSARLNDGTLVECVYFMTAAASRRLLGREGPEGPSDSRWIPAHEVASVSASPVRLAAIREPEIPGGRNPQRVLHVHHGVLPLESTRIHDRRLR
jgi:hypothetical protein